MSKPLSTEKLDELVYSILASSLEFRSRLNDLLQDKIVLDCENQTVVFETTQTVVLEYEGLVRQLMKTNAELVKTINSLA